MKTEELRENKRSQYTPYREYNRQRKLGRDVLHTAIVPKLLEWERVRDVEKGAEEEGTQRIQKHIIIISKSSTKDPTRNLQTRLKPRCSEPSLCLSFW